MTQTDFNATYQHIVSLLEQEEDTFASFIDIAQREARRERIEQEISMVAATITAFNRRLHNLPTLPPLDIAQWAQAVLEMPNLAFVVLETTGVEDNADIIRVFVASRDGDTLYDQVIQPERNFTANTAYTGLTIEQISSVSPLDAYWPRINAVLTGRYVLGFNLQFIHNHLAENAKNYDLSPITLIGEDLQEKCRRFWDDYYPPKLMALCEKLAYALPTPATAPDRALAQLAILRAMAIGITSVKREEPTRESDEYSPF